MVRLFMLPTVLLLVACSGSSAPPATAERPVPPGKGDAPARAGATPKAAPKPDEPAPGSYQAADATPREVRYLVKPDGLQIDVAGTRFRPRATAVSLGGGWGIQIEVEASADDDQQHSLLSGTDGALAFAGAVSRRGSSVRFKDQRGQGEEQLLFPGAPITLSRTWPEGTGQKPLGVGDEIDLHVGLWGLGEDATSRRPVLKFFRVHMKVGDGTPQPKLTPPE